ncbi:MAG TPA: PKD domain-containing protein [Saprospiraceae bacterium]|nr:PKD domain-containing protein [Saprospiraceae bacterium]
MNRSSININIIGKNSWVFLFFILFSSSLFATHWVGGQLNYRCLGNNNFEIKVVVRQDCKNGQEPYDDPAIVGIFYGDNQTYFRKPYLSIKPYSVEILNEKLDRFCATKADEVCVQEIVYLDTVNLPLDERGFILSYQRCCRNVTLTNLKNPLEQGTTYVVHISYDDILSCNSNPVFGRFAPIYICVNEQFSFDHSATDNNSDSLVYKLCNPYEGRTLAEPQGIPSNPPYKEVTWQTSYSLANLTNDLSLPGGSVMKIDRRTGQLTCIPNVIGQFLVGVCVEEWKSGKLVSFTNRDFELNVVPCGVKPKASFTVSSTLCDGLNQSFKNTSIDATSYQWYFDYNGNRNLNSPNTDPTVSYPVKGTYEVVLVAINGSCTDTARKTITVIDPGLVADFDYTLNCKSGLILSFTNKSKANGTIVSYNWSITGNGNNHTSTQPDPIIVLTNGGKITTSLTVTDNNGCTKVVSKTIDVTQIEVELIGKEAHICKGEGVKIVKNPNASYTYNWSPTTGLDLNPPSNPTAKPEVTTTYKVTITDPSGLCSIEREITVFVRELVNLKVTGDTTTCTGKVNLTASSDSTSNFVWSTNPSFNPVIATGANLMTNINSTTTFYVRAGNDSQCKAVLAVKVHDNSVKLNYSKELAVCIGDTISLMLTKVNPADVVTIQWVSNPIIISTTDPYSPKILVASPGTYSVVFSATNQHGCTLNDTIKIIAVNPPVPDFNIKYDCGSLTVDVFSTNKGAVRYDFGDGKGSANTPNASYTYEKSGEYTITMTVDSVCARSITKTITVVELKEELDRELKLCEESCVNLNPVFNTNYTYKWSPSVGLDDANSPNPKACPTSTTTYTVTISDNRFPVCSINLQITVNVNNKPVLGKDYNRSVDTTLCEESEITLYSNVSSGIKGTWCDQNGKDLGAGNIKLRITQSTYFIFKIEKDGCLWKDTVNVTLYKLDVTLTGNDRICKGDTAMIIANSPNLANYKFEWSPQGSIIGSNTGTKISVKPDVTTTYNVIVDNNKGCKWVLNYTVNVNDPSNGIFVKAEPEIIVPGVKSQLTTVNIPGYKYQWSPTDGLSDPNIYNPTAMPTKTTTYTVKVTDEIGCMATATVTVTVTTCESTVFIPNAFSPNGDNKNDVLRVHGPFINSMELVIVNRWGQEMFRTKDQNNPWDGSYQGTMLGPDVFGYCIEYVCPDNSKHAKKGNVSILK